METAETGGVGAGPGVPIAGGVHDTVITFATRTLNIGIGMVQAFLMAALLEPAGRGSYAVCSQYSGLLTVLFMLGTDVACQYYVASRKVTPSQGALAMLLYVLVSSVLAIGVGLALMQTRILRHCYKFLRNKQFALMLVLNPFSGDKAWRANCGPECTR